MPVAEERLEVSDQSEFLNVAVNFRSSLKLLVTVQSGQVHLLLPLSSYHRQLFRDEPTYLQDHQ
jgi:hypothetical protein